MNSISNNNLLGLFTYVAGSSKPILRVQKDRLAIFRNDALQVRAEFNATIQLSQQTTQPGHKYIFSLLPHKLKYSGAADYRSIILETSIPTDTGYAGSSSFSLTDYDIVEATGTLVKKTNPVGAGSVNLQLAHPVNDPYSKYVSSAFLATGVNGEDNTPTTPPGANAYKSAILSGTNNRISKFSSRSVILGGNDNIAFFAPAEGTPALLAKLGASTVVRSYTWTNQPGDNVIQGHQNHVSGYRCAVDGTDNLVMGNYQSVSGYYNVVLADYGTVSGYNNQVSAGYSFVSGYYNSVGSHDPGYGYSTVTGYSNGMYGKYGSIDGHDNFIACGNENSILGSYGCNIMPFNWISDKRNYRKGVVAYDIKADDNSMSGNTISGSYYSKIRSANTCHIVAGNNCKLDGSDSNWTSSFYQNSIFGGHSNVITTPVLEYYDEGGTRTGTRDGAARFTIIGGVNNLIGASGECNSILNGYSASIYTASALKANDVSMSANTIIGGYGNKITPSNRRRNVFGATSYGGTYNLADAEYSYANGVCAHTKGRSNAITTGAFNEGIVKGETQLTKLLLTGKASSATPSVLLVSNPNDKHTTYQQGQVLVMPKDSYYLQATVIATVAETGSAVGKYTRADIAVWKYEAVISREVTKDSTSVTEISKTAVTSTANMAGIDFSVSANAAHAAIEFKSVLTGDHLTETNKVTYLVKIELLELGSGRFDVDAAV